MRRRTHRRLATVKALESHGIHDAPLHQLALRLRGDAGIHRGE